MLDFQDILCLLNVFLFRFFYPFFLLPAVYTLLHPWTYRGTFFP